VRLLCATHPIQAQYVGDQGHALHVACQRQPTARAVQALLEAFPAAASLPNAQGELALHVACRNNASIAVIRHLVQHYPASAASAASATSVQPSAVVILCQSSESMETNMEANNSAVLWRTRQDDLPRITYTSLFWQKMQVLLEGVAMHRQCIPQAPQGAQSFYILHVEFYIGSLQRLHRRCGCGCIGGQGDLGRCHELAQQCVQLCVTEF
jgi:Ankyrin repeat